MSLPDAHTAPGMAQLPTDCDVTIAYFYPRTVTSDAPGKRMVHGIVDLGTRYMLSLQTSQSRKTVLDVIKRARKRGDGLVAFGRWSEEAFTGDSGERYRPLIGRLELLSALARRTENAG